MQTYYLEAAFTIQKDLSEEYSEEKIQIRNNVKQLLQNLCEGTIKILGLYGYTETVHHYITQEFKVHLQIDIELTYHKKACVGLVNMENLLVLCYLIPENSKLESVETQLLRILIDTCQNIVLLPTQGILDKWVPIKNQQLKNKISSYQSQDIDSGSCGYQKINQNLIITEFPYNKYQNKLNQVLFYNIKQEEYGKLIEQYFHEQAKNVMLYGRYNEDIEFPCSQFNQNYISKVHKEVLLSLNHYFKQVKDNIENGLYEQLQLRFSPEEFPFLKLAKFFLNNAFRKLNSFKDNSEILKGPELIKEVRVSIFRLKSKELLCKLIRVVIKYINKEFSKMQDFVNRKIKNIMEKIEIEQGVGQEFVVEIKLLKFKVYRHMDQKFKSVEFLTKDIVVQKEKETKLQKENLHNYELVDYFPVQNEGKSNDFLLIMKCQSVETKCRYHQVYFMQETRKPVMIVTYFELQNPYFYYSIDEQILYQFNQPKKIVISQLNIERECIETEKIVDLDEFIYIIQYNYSDEYGCFLMLSDEKKIYKWQPGETYFSNQKQSIQEKEGTVIERDFDNDYITLLTCGFGKYYLLFKIQGVDIFDFNNTLLQKIQFDNCYFKEEIYLFSDNYDSFIFLQKDSTHSELYQLINFNRKSKLTGQFNQRETQQNYFLDLIKQAFVIYGKNSTFLNVTKPLTNLISTSSIKSVIQEYFYSIQMQKYCVLALENDMSEVEQINLKNILSSRVPIQLCTFECKRLIVLSDGLNKLNQNFDSIQIDQQLKQISFGLIEEISPDKPIYVVSILGKQSGGKSYLLNQLFGVRFGVSSARCTDGIWCSQINMEGCNFLILDCEGLFGQRRNNLEEITLLSFLTAISDLTIFNQQASYDRHLNDIFDDLVEANSRLKGDLLFQGKLMILVRDIYQDGAENAQRELDGSLDQIINSNNNELFKSLLKNGIQAQLMSYFELEQFEDDIQQIREQIVKDAQQSTRWADVQQLLTTMKITLLQLSVKDTRNIQDYELSYQIHKLKEIANNYWYDIPIWGIKNEGIPQQLIQTNNMDQNFKQLLPQALQIVNQQGDLSFISKYNKVDKLLQQFANKRIACILGLLSKEIDQKLVQRYQLDKELKNNLLFECENELKHHLHSYKLCGQSCSQCYSLCTQFNGHLSKNGSKLEKARIGVQKKKAKISMMLKQLDLEDNVDVVQLLAQEREIYIDLLTQQSKIKGDRVLISRLNVLKEIQQQIYASDCKMKKLSNTLIIIQNLQKEQEYIQQFNSQHICWSDTHKCEAENCELLQSHVGDHYFENNNQCDQECLLCHNQCILKIGHVNNSLHYCKDKHVCQETCQYCAEQCTQDPFIEHIHMCNLRFCNKSCSLNNCLRQCGQQHSHELENEHFCNCFHQCDKLCNLPGICTVDGYVKRVKMWRSNAGSLYGQTIYEQVRRKEKCFKLMPVGHNCHDLGHSCQNRKHLCDQQCPGCKAYCYLESGHTNLHHTIYHNTIEFHCSSFNLDVQNQDVQFCRPETCDEYCQRLGRGHSHKIECRDSFLCYENQLNKGQKYIKAIHQDQDTDQILCKQFWEIQGWEQPLRGVKRTEVSKCCAKCPQCDRYCNYMAWHEMGNIHTNHKFDCNELHQIKAINIAFIIDQTDQYNIQIAIDVLRIMAHPKFKFPVNKTKIAIILYTDHHPLKHITQPTQILCDFCDLQTSLSKLQDVKAKNNKHDYPNAVIDGLYAQQELQWATRCSQKFALLLTQAPPHGQPKYHSFEDNFPKGCPCNLKEIEVLKNFRQKQIQLIVPVLSNHINLMIKVFQNYLQDLVIISNKSIPEAIIKYLQRYFKVQNDI